jgi:catechol 2,3-dioxygenase-like lactoylglutathione lyase family enzyme
MITAIHALLYSRDAEATRAFFRDILKFKSVDAGDGWLIFALPPAELGVHPTDTAHGPELHLLCDDVARTVAELEAMGVKATRPISDQGYGLVTSIRIPGGIEIGLYEPRHKTAVSLKASRPKHARSATRHKRAAPRRKR